MKGSGSAADNIAQNRHYWRSSHYYALAEPDIEDQWRDLIWPILAGFDFSVVVEIAPGHGRSSRKLLERCGELHLVDLNPECIDACRERFGGSPPVHYHVNDGLTLPRELDGRATLVYCWDSVVHFHREVVASYLREIRRALAPGGRAFLHHANLSPEQVVGDWTDKPHWRNDVTAELVRELAERTGLRVESQHALRWAGEIDDAISVLRRD